jgi:hypothetical protein
MGLQDTALHDLLNLFSKCVSITEGDPVPYTVTQQDTALQCINELRWRVIKDSVPPCCIKVADGVFVVGEKNDITTAFADKIKGGD